jgi:hypothetical protein
MASAAAPVRPRDGGSVLPQVRQARPTLTVVMPCYNEAERLPGTLRSLLAHLSGVPGEVEVLVVDDGPTDAPSWPSRPSPRWTRVSGCFACPLTVAREPRYGLAFDHGSEQARAALQGFLALKGRITLETKLVVTVGELAYLANTWSLSGTGPDGNPVVLGATTAEVARRQADGSWRYVIDNAWGDQAVGGSP